MIASSPVALSGQRKKGETYFATGFSPNLTFDKEIRMRWAILPHKYMYSSTYVVQCCGSCTFSENSRVSFEWWKLLLSLCSVI